jgi:hypothetical protein
MSPQSELEQALKSEVSEILTELTNALRVYHALMGNIDMIHPSYETPGGRAWFYACFEAKQRAQPALRHREGFGTWP